MGHRFNFFERSLTSFWLENTAKTVGPLPVMRTKDVPSPCIAAMALGIDGLKQNAEDSKSLRTNSAASRILCFPRK